MLQAEKFWGKLYTPNLSWKYTGSGFKSEIVNHLHRHESSSQENSVRTG